MLNRAPSTSTPRPDHGCAAAIIRGARSVSSFGFGGSNFHVTLEEYTGSAGQKGSLPPIADRTLSGQRRQRRAASSATARRSPTGSAMPSGFQFLARETQLTFDEHTSGSAFHRGQRFRRSSGQSRRGQRGHPPRSDHGPAVRPSAGPTPASTPSDRDSQLAFIFPGQGSQYVGMGSDLARLSPRARQSGMKPPIWNLS